MNRTSDIPGDDPAETDSGLGVTPYRFRIAEAARDDLGGDEQLLAATRVVLPFNRSRYDETLKERNTLGDLALLQHLLVLVRPAPKPIAGFPVFWDMVLGLTRNRIIVWKPRRGSEQPTALLGSVQLDDLERVGVATVPDRKGRTLALKISLAHGPTLLLDVLAGFRAETEEFAEETQHHIEVRRFLA